VALGVKYQMMLLVHVKQAEEAQAELLVSDSPAGVFQPLDMLINLKM
jgi:hypothetical protein